MNVAPAAEALAELDRIAPRQRNACELGHLHASSLDGALAGAVDEGREHDCRPDLGVVAGGHVEDEVVNGAGCV